MRMPSRAKVVATSEGARRTMQANRAVSSREIAFRKALWAAGARGYRVKTPLPGRPDIVFPALRLAIFVNGCFWHLCPAVQPAATAWKRRILEGQAGGKPRPGCSGPLSATGIRLGGA